MCPTLQNKYLQKTYRYEFKSLQLLNSCVYAYIRICVYVCVHVCMHACMYMCIYIYVYFKQVLLFSSNSKHCKQIGKCTGISYQLETVASRCLSFYWWAPWNLCGGHAHMLSSLRRVLFSCCEPCYIYHARLTHPEVLNGQLQHRGALLVPWVCRTLRLQQMCQYLLHLC